VGIVIWQQVGCTGSHIVSINQRAIADEFGIDRTTVHRGVRDLEQAGLISVVESHPGRRLKVELNELPCSTVVTASPT